MTNTSSAPLEIRHDRVDPAVLAAIRKIDGIARKHEARYFVAGPRHAKSCSVTFLVDHRDAGPGMSILGLRFNYYRLAGLKIGEFYRHNYWPTWLARLNQSTIMRLRSSRFRGNGWPSRS